MKIKLSRKWLNSKRGSSSSPGYPLCSLKLNHKISLFKANHPIRSVQFSFVQTRIFSSEWIYVGLDLYGNICNMPSNCKFFHSLLKWRYLSYSWYIIWWFSAQLVKSNQFFYVINNLINTTLKYISISTSKNYQSSLPPSFLMVSNQDVAFS